MTTARPPARGLRGGGQRLATNLALLAGALAAALLFAEGVLRLFGLASPVLYRIDAAFGYEPVPGQTSTRLGTRVHINDVGLRDDETLAELMRSSERILVIGNSVTYGSSLVEQEELFTEVMERELRATRPELKVLNAGVAGYSVSQMAKRAPRLIERTAPHYLVVYVIRNDFQRAPGRYPAENSTHEPLRRPRLALAAFTQHSLGFIDGRYRIRERLPFLKPVWPRGPASIVPPYDRERVVDIHFEALEELLRVGWEGTGRARSRVLLVVSPSRGDLAEHRADRNKDLVRRARALGIRVYDLHGDFRRAVEAGEITLDELYHDDIHYRPQGNALAGRLLAEHLRRGLLGASE